MKKENALSIDMSTAICIDKKVWYLPEYHVFFETEAPDAESLAWAIKDQGLVPVRERYLQDIARTPKIFFEKHVLHENLRTLTIEMTNGCNLGCPQCYLNGSGRLQKDLFPVRRDIEEKTIFDRLNQILDKSKQKEITLQFIGGEPLFKKGLIRKIIPTLKNMGTAKGIKINFQVITNGVLLDPEIMRFFDFEDVEILLSLEGPAHIQNMLRPFKNGDPTAEIVMRNISGYESKIAIIFLLCQQTRNVTDNINFFLEKGFKGVSFNYAFTVDPNIALRAEDTAFILDDMDRNWSFYETNFLKIRNFRRILGSLDVERAQVISCNAGRNYAAMGADGHYYICQRAYGMENLRLDVLLKPDSPYRAHSVEDFAPCRCCWARYICGGICWFNSWYWPEEYRSIRCNFMREFIKRVARIRFKSKD